MIDECKGSDSVISPIQIRRPVLDASGLIKAMFRMSIGIDDVDSLHVTIVYSRHPVNTSREVFTPDPNPLILSSPVFLPVRFGPDEDLLALSFRDHGLEMRHRDLLAAGCSHDYPGYTPHITIGPCPSDIRMEAILCGPLHLGGEIRKAAKPYPDRSPEPSL